MKKRASLNIFAIFIITLLVFSWWFRGLDRDPIPSERLIDVVEPEIGEDKPENFASWAEVAISWAKNYLDPLTWHWDGLCLRFVANAFMQKGGYPKIVREGTWASAWDAVNGDEVFDLVLQDPDNWRGAPDGVLIFFGQTEDNRHGHIAIYLGDGRIIHAYGEVRIDYMTQVRYLDEGRIGPYIGWSFPPERWRP